MQMRLSGQAQCLMREWEDLCRQYEAKKAAAEKKRIDTDNYTDTPAAQKILEVRQMERELSRQIQDTLQKVGQGSYRYDGTVPMTMIARCVEHQLLAKPIPFAEDTSAEGLRQYYENMLATALRKMADRLRASKEELRNLRRKMREEVAQQEAELKKLQEAKYAWLKNHAAEIEAMIAAGMDLPGSLFQNHRGQASAPHVKPGACPSQPPAQPVITRKRRKKKREKKETAAADAPKQEPVDNGPWAIYCLGNTSGEPLISFALSNNFGQFAQALCDYYKLKPKTGKILERKFRQLLSTPIARRHQDHKPWHHWSNDTVAYSVSSGKYRLVAYFEDDQRKIMIAAGIRKKIYFDVGLAPWKS